MIAPTVHDARRAFAEAIRVASNIVSGRIVDALASVPRERYLPAGPWQIRGVTDIGGPPRRTEDADPRHVYQDVSIAIDSSRNLYNGQPSLIARWLDKLDLRPGDRVVHIGCGTGYYTALIAHAVGSEGRVQAIEVDSELVASARENLADQPWVDVHHGNGTGELLAETDRILVHAGATHVVDAWIDALADGGRLLLPLTVEFPGMPAGISKGIVLLLMRRGSEWHVDPGGTMPVAIYSLQDIRDASLNESIARALTNRTLLRATRLRRDPHEPTSSCVVHGPSNCLSM